MRRRCAPTDPGSELRAYQTGQGQKSFKDGGYIVTNANCSTTGLAIPMSAIYEEFGLRFLCVSTYQAVSGAGYPGVPSLDILGNVVPYIKNEEEKMEAEIFKMLGVISPKGGIKNATFDMVASCARVPVVDGHMESAAMIMGKAPTVEEITKLLNEFRAEPQKLELPTAPKQPIIVRRRGGPAAAGHRRLRRGTGTGPGHGGHRRQGAAERQVHQDVGALPQHHPRRRRRLGDQRGAGQGKETVVGDGQ